MRWPASIDRMQGLYPSWGPWALLIKQCFHFAIGAGIALIFLFYVFLNAFQCVCPFCAWINNLVGESFLAFTGKGLALATGIELAYMLFTEGPDEALTPVIMGVASTILIALAGESEADKIWITKDIDVGVTAVLGAIALGFLFFVRARYDHRDHRPETIGGSAEPDGPKKE